MAWTEDLAKQNGLKNCSLVVDIDHASTFAFYRALGYQAVEIVTTPQFEEKFHTRGHRRTVRDLTGG
jgi:hypothetical protein